MIFTPPLISKSSWPFNNPLVTVTKAPIKRILFQAAVVLILLYGSTPWTQTERLEKKLDGIYARILRAVLNKSWRQHPTKQQLYGHQPPFTKTIQVRRTKHAEHCWRSIIGIIVTFMFHTFFNSLARTRDLSFFHILSVLFSGQQGQ